MGRAANNVNKGQCLSPGAARTCFSFAKPLAKEGVVESIRSNQTISEPVRQNAQEPAEPFTEEKDARPYNQASWSLVRQAPTRSP